MYENTPIAEFFERYIAAIQFDGHRKSNVGDKKLHCRKIAAFAEERGDKTYSVALGNTFLERFLTEQGEDYHSKQPYPRHINIVIRTVNTLNDFFLGLPFQRMYRRSKHTILSAEQNETIAKFVESLSSKRIRRIVIRKISS